jgi:hypothetical protein
MRCCACSCPALAAFTGLTRTAVALRFARRLGGLETNYPRGKLQSGTVCCTGSSACPQYEFRQELRTHTQLMRRLIRRSRRHSPNSFQTMGRQRLQAFAGDVRNEVRNHRARRGSRDPTRGLRALIEPVSAIG